MREALGREGAEVEMALDEICFETGQDFHNFARNLKIDVNGMEIVQ